MTIETMKFEKVSESLLIFANARRKKMDKVKDIDIKAAIKESAENTIGMMQTIVRLRKERDMLKAELEALQAEVAIADARVKLIVVDMDDLIDDKEEDE